MDCLDKYFIDVDKTLEDYLNDNGYGTGSQSQSLSELLDLIHEFPDFDFTSSLTFSMERLFVDRYKKRKLCVEKYEDFEYYFKRKIEELLLEYEPKIEMWIDHFNDLFKFTVSLEMSDTTELENSRDNTYYLNPVNTVAGVEQDLKVQEKTNNSDTGSKTRTVTKDVLQSVWGKTRAQLLEQILNLKNIYADCLKAFEPLFLGVL